MKSQKRKKQHDLLNAQQREATEAARDEEELGSKIADRHEARGKKCRIVSVLDIEIEQTESLARSNKDVNAESQMRQMTVHRSMMDSDTAHIDNEVHLSALEEGLTLDC
jgi:hypothetical protein